MSCEYVIKALGLWGGDVWHTLLEESGSCDMNQISKNYFVFKTINSRDRKYDVRTETYEMEVSHLDVIVDKIRHETNWKSHLGQVLKTCVSIDEFRKYVNKFDGEDLPPWYPNLVEWIDKLGILHLEYQGTKFTVGIKYNLTKDGKDCQSQG